MLTGVGRAAQLLRAKPTRGRLMVTAADVEGILKNQLSAQDVQVIDTSGGCGASFDVAVVSDQFEGKKLLERHRMVRQACCTPVCVLTLQSVVVSGRPPFEQE